MRRFIRMEELSDFVTVSKGDVLDAIENKKITYCAPVDWKNLGAVIHKDKRKYVHAVFDYSGMIFLGYNKSREMAIHAQPIEVDMVGILERDKVTNWRSVPQAFKGVKSSVLPFLDESEPIPDGYFKAHALVEAGFTGLQARQNLMTLLNGLSEGRSTVGEHDISQYLVSNTVTIHPDAMRVDLVQLEGEFLGCEIDQKATARSPASATVIDELTHPIEQIVERMLSKDSTLRADKIWNALRRDVNQDGARTYDIDNVIDEMTSDSMTWFGRGISSENSMSYDSFRKTTVYRVKARLRKRRQ